MIEQFIGDQHENKEIVEFISLRPFPLVWTSHYNFFNPEDFGVPPFRGSYQTITTEGIVCSKKIK